MSARSGGPASVAIRGAAQILRPPRDGMTHLRGDELTAQTLEPGDLALRDGRIAALDDDPLAQLAVDASGCAVIPGFVDCHTHLPFAGWRAAASTSRRSPASPTSRSPVRAVGSGPRRGL